MSQCIFKWIWLRLIIEGVLYENLFENTASYSQGRLIVEGVFYSRKYGIFKWHITKFKMLNLKELFRYSFINWRIRVVVQRSYIYCTVPCALNVLALALITVQFLKTHAEAEVHSPLLLPPACGRRQKRRHAEQKYSHVEAAAALVRYALIAQRATRSGKKTRQCTQSTRRRRIHFARMRVQ